jgi:hypothetical protein
MAALLAATLEQQRAELRAHNARIHQANKVRGAVQSAAQRASIPTSELDIDAVCASLVRAFPGSVVITEEQYNGPIGPLTGWRGKVDPSDEVGIDDGLREKGGD